MEMKTEKNEKNKKVEVGKIESKDVLQNKAKMEDKMINETKRVLNKKLLKAARSGDIEQVKKCIERGANIEANDPNYGEAKDHHAYGKTALMHAAEKGHLSIAKLLIERGANVNAKNTSYGGTALAGAAFMGHIKIVKLLIDNGADFRDHDTLVDAVKQGHMETVKLLIEKGADVNAKGRSGCALYWAAFEDHFMDNIEMVKFLIEHGADVNAKRESCNETPLHCVARIELAKLLIEKGADVNAIDSDGCTALMNAAARGDKEMVDLLIANKADVKINVTSKEGTVLMYAADTRKDDAADARRYEIMKLLIEKGADVNAKKDDGTTALMCAAWRGKKEIVKLLIEKGADVNAVTTGERWSAVQAAYYNEHEEIVKLLREHGANGPMWSRNEGYERFLMYAPYLPEGCYR